MYRQETTLKGLAVSKGMAVARVCLFNEGRHADLPGPEKRTGKPEVEVARLKDAISTAVARLSELQQRVQREVGKAEAEIFFAQSMILQDKTLLKTSVSKIEAQRMTAEAAVSSVLDGYEAKIASLDNEYIRERATDFGEVKRRLLDVLANMTPTFKCEGQTHCQRGHDRIVVAVELTPSLTMDLDTHHTLGFVTERGGVNSHAAILARALGIPAVSGITGIHSQLGCGTEVLIDGNTGTVVVNPSESTVARAQEANRQAVRTPRAVDPVAGFTVMANISSAAEAETAVGMKAEGIGLYRTEFEMFAQHRFLDEDEQYEHYASVVKSMAGRPATFRLLDIGGDKPAPFLEMPHEDNPYLGWRGARLLLDNESVLKTQARALARAGAHGPVGILYPMIVDLDQFKRVRSIVENAVADLPRTNLRHGVMFEVPSACLDAEEILQYADFGSIGTNDLIQYLFAVDRNNERVAHDYRPDRPALWTLIRHVAEAGEKTGKPVSICGELGGDPNYLARIMKAGIRIVSVSPRLIPGVRTAAQAESIRK